MNTENPTRRSGPHAPLPTGVGAAVASAIATASTTSEASQAVTQAPPPREEDPRTRAARRAAELRDHWGGSMDDGDDKFYIDPSIIPDGWSYEWKRFTVLGKEDPSYQVSLAHKGWEAVPRSRHPQLMPDNYHGETIERDGQILMERPLEITQEARARDKREARALLKGKEAQLGLNQNGQFERDNKGNSMVSVKKSFEAIPIPEK